MGLSEPESFNRYSYVLNDPVNLSDPHGKCAIEGTDDTDDCLFDQDLFGSLPDIGFDTYVEAQIQAAIAAIYAQLAANPPQATAPVWNISVGYTPVVNFGGSGGGSYDHLFIVLYTGALSSTNPSNIVLDGGPSHGLLESRVGSPGSTGHYSETTRGSMNYFFTSTLSTSTEQTLYKDGQNLSSALSGAFDLYNPVFGPNSNRVAYTLLSEVGLNIPLKSVTTGLGQQLGYINFNGQNQWFTGWGQNVP